MNENFHLETKVLNEIIDKCKTHGDKRCLGYINKDESPFKGEIVCLLKVRMIPLTKQNLLKRHQYAQTLRK